MGRVLTSAWAGLLGLLLGIQAAAGEPALSPQAGLEPLHAPHCGKGYAGYPRQAPCDFPHVFVRTENLWLHRDLGDNAIVAAGQGPGGPFIVGTDDLDLDLEPGLRLVMGVALNCNTYLEGSYGWTDQWRIFRRLAADGVTTVITTGATGLLTAGSITQQTTEYQVYNHHEVLLGPRTYIYVYPHVSVLAGGRFLKMDEEFLVDEVGMAAGVPASALIRRSTTNTMIGVYFGSEAIFQLGRRFEVGPSAMGMVFSNWSEVKTARGATAGLLGPVAQSGFQDGQKYVLGFEVGAVATLRITDRCLLRGGYRALYLDGVAVASEQPIVAAAGATLPQSLDDDGSVLIQGFFGGLELRWGTCD